MKPYTLGIIGAGMIAEEHLKAFKKTNKTIIKWSARKDKSQLPDFQNKYEILNGTADYREILNDDEVDAVIITSPPHTHYAMFMDTVKAKKHVLLEKPAAIHPGELTEMVAETKKHPDLIICDCSARHTRLQPKYKKTKEIIDSGILGQIYYLHHNAVNRQRRPGIEYHPAAKWFTDESRAGGGPLIDWGVYDLSFHLGLLGDNVRLEKINDLFIQSNLDNYHDNNNVTDVEESFTAMLEFSGGIKYYWERAAHANMETMNETRVYGTRGGLKLNFCTWDPDIIYHYYLDNQNISRVKEIQVDTSKQNDHEALANHFIDLLEKKSSPAMSLELAAKHLEIIFKLYGKV